ncbi:recombinase family protein [Embleya sp. NPDC059237]|uniref:recombinase family protein n=1 Tax=Embleya sp. NPDC059237 TaxID=3346784 RepID=UPI00367FFADC
MSSRLYGFDTRHNHVAEETPWVERAADDALLLVPLAQVCRTLNAGGSRTTSGGLWHATTLRRVLIHPAIAGLERKGDNLVKAEWDAIIAPDKHHALVRLFTDPARTPGASYDYMLTSGGSECSECRSWMGARPSNSGRASYSCRAEGCKKVRISASLLEQYMGEHVLAELVKPETAGRLAAARRTLEAEAQALRATLVLIETQEAEAGTEYAARRLSMVTMKEIARGLQAQRKPVKARLRFLDSILNTEPNIGSDPVKWWNKNASVAARRTVTLLLVERVIVHPASAQGVHSVEPGRVSILWRSLGSRQGN